MLNPGALESDWEALLRSPTTDFRQAARRMASAYARYAAGATSCAGGSPVLTSQETVLANTLAGVLAAGNPASVPLGVATALAAFWLSPPVVFPSVIPGAVTLAVPAPLAAALAGILGADLALASAGAPVDAGAVASQWTAALDTWTRSVIVSHLPGGCVGPLV